MSDLFSQGLLIAVIGMGLVFLALDLLWGLMALMASIRFKSDKKAQEAETEVAMTAMVRKEVSDELRMRAAAAAVATALSLQRPTFKGAPPESKVISPWQLAQRASKLARNSNVTNRKPRGYS